MDLDQNENAISKGGKFKVAQVNKSKAKNRAFGQDITNKQRPRLSQENENNSKPKASSFDVVKPTIEIIADRGEPEIAKSEDVEMDIIGDSVELAPWDMMDIDNDLFVTDYVGDIMSGLHEDEVLNRGGCIIEKERDFMKEQNDVNERMRAVLVDWLVEVHRKFKLLPSTYFLGINLLDRYLAKTQLHRKQLQLCGCACLWIASKYHEIYAPEIDDFVYISDNAFNDDQLKEMEIEILKQLKFTLTVPTVLNYAERYSKISGFYLKKTRERRIISDLIMYCIEHCVMSYSLCRKRPSLLGAASFVYSCISTKVFSVESFKKDNMEKVVGYTLKEIMPVMKIIDFTVKNSKKSKHKAVLKKYSNSKYSNIGKLNFEKLNTSFLYKESS